MMPLSNQPPAGTGPNGDRNITPDAMPQYTSNRADDMQPQTEDGLGPAADTAPQRLTLQDAKVIAAVNRVKPAVVGVINLKAGEDRTTRRNQSLVEEATGSGFIFETRGNRARIITNNHVVAGADEVDVSLNNGERVKARILGRDALTDLAVLEIDSSGIDAVAEVGNSDHLLVGEPAIAIGSPLGLSFSQSVTLGVISATQRSIPSDVNNDGVVDWELEAIQTDAAINPGNSGGPLVDIDGQVIGINSMKISEPGVEGMGFAIPISQAMPVVDELVTRGKVIRPYLGVTPKDLRDIPQDEQRATLHLPANVKDGVVVLDAKPPATAAGLRQYDVIVAMDNRPIGQSADLRRYMYTHKEPGDRIEVSFYRGAQLKRAVIRLTTMQP
jgi:serine protease Do